MIFPGDYLGSSLTVSLLCLQHVLGHVGDYGCECEEHPSPCLLCIVLGPRSAPQTSSSLIAGIRLADVARTGPVSHADIARVLLVDVCVDGGQDHRLLGPCG